MSFKPLEQIIKEYYDKEKGVFPVVSNCSDTFAVKNVTNTTLVGNEVYSKAFDAAPVVKVKKKVSFAGIASNIIFYFVILGAVLLAFSGTGKTAKSPRNILGFSYFTVLSGSMQQEIPKGALVLTKRIDAGELNIGDNITFLKSSNTTVTHKIVGIYENYGENGGRGFQTQGTNNSQPDRDAVPASNVVGKVIFSVPALGALLSMLSNNLILVLLFLGFLLILSFSLQILFRVKKDEKEQMNTAYNQSFAYKKAIN